REVDVLQRLLVAPAPPFVAVLGGAKVSDKIGVLENLLGRVQAVCIGGAMAYTFLRAQGKPVGRSRVEADKVDLAAATLARAAARWRSRTRWRSRAARRWSGAATRWPRSRAPGCRAPSPTSRPAAGRRSSSSRGARCPGWSRSRTPPRPSTRPCRDEPHPAHRRQLEDARRARRGGGAGERARQERRARARARGRDRASLH